MAKMTPNNLLALKLVLTEPQTKLNKTPIFSIFVELEQYDFSGNLAMHSVVYTLETYVLNLSMYHLV